MADVSHVVTLGIGTPGAIPQFILVGLSPSPVPAAATTKPSVLLTGRYATTVGLAGRYAPSPALTGRWAPDIDLEA